MPARAVHSLNKRKAGRKFGLAETCASLPLERSAEAKAAHPQDEASEGDDAKDEQRCHRDERGDIVDIVGEQYDLAENVGSKDC